MHEEAHDVKPGKYRHFKGGLYEVMGIARHSETLETLVLYRHVEGDTTPWVRPLAMFTELVVDHGGARVPRFARVDDTSTEQKNV